MHMTTENKIDITCLNEEQVKKRKESGLANTAVKSGTKTKEQIYKENIFTFFNFVFIVLALLLVVAGKFSDLTFLAVVVANTCIGIVQALNSKKAVDKLTILAAKKVKVHRAEGIKEVPSDELVRDDIIEISSGSQIPADAVVLDGSLKVNESLISGEEDDIEKHVGDELKSGSACTSGMCLARLTAVGSESYAARLSLEATTDVKMAKSDMMRSLDHMIMVIGFLLVPIGILLFWNEFVILDESFSDSIQSMVAGLIGMIPEGLYLLTSIALAASVLRLSKKRVLVRELNCVETLARVDTLCVDKTGTITEPGMNVEDVLVMDNADRKTVENALAAFSRAFAVQNDTAQAIAAYFSENPGWTVTGSVPFSSSIKYSAASFAEYGNLVVGAPQFVFENRLDEIDTMMDPYVNNGMRVLLAGKYNHPLDGGKIDDSLVEPVALIAISNHVRKNAAETFAYFKSQGVNIKVISGDDARTVSRIAVSVNIPDAENYVDSTTLTTDDAIKDAVLKYTVFGRTTPDQKKKMVMALKEHGRHVAMTGDGVNDVLALKEADCGIAMATGADAACQIAQLVLLDSDFSAVPDIVAEGRRVINNIERSARLFLAKNIFSIGLSILCVALQLSYPLKPLQISFISALTIGIPGFFLAMQPNDGIITGRFISNVLYYAFPGGLCDLILIGGISAYAYYFSFTDAETNTMALVAALVVGMMILYDACRPLNLFRRFILCMMCAASAACLIFFGDIMGVSALSIQAVLIFVLFMCLAYPCMYVLQMIFIKANRLYQKAADKLTKKKKTAEES